PRPGPPRPRARHRRPSPSRPPARRRRPRPARRPGPHPPGHVGGRRRCRGITRRRGLADLRRVPHRRRRRRTPAEHPRRRRAAAARPLRLLAPPGSPALPPATGAPPCPGYLATSAAGPSPPRTPQATAFAILTSQDHKVIYLRKT